MAAVSAPGARRSLLGMVVAAVQARAQVKRRPSKLATFAVRAREHVPTTGALAAAVEGAFHWGPGVGWLAVAGAIVVLDWAVTGR